MILLLPNKLDTNTDTEHKHTFDAVSIIFIYLKKEQVEVLEHEVEEFIQ